MAVRIIKAQTIGGRYYGALDLALELTPAEEQALLQGGDAELVGQANLPPAYQLNQADVDAVKSSSSGGSFDLVDWDAARNTSPVLVDGVEPTGPHAFRVAVPGSVTLGGRTASTVDEIVYWPKGGTGYQWITADLSITAPTLTSLSIVNLTDRTTVRLLGRNAVGDGGGGMFRFDATSSATADGGVVIAFGTGRLFRDGYTVFGFNGRAYPEWWGALADGTNRGPELQLAANYCMSVRGHLHLPAIYCTAHTLRIDRGMTLTSAGVADDSADNGEPTFWSGLKWIGSNTSSDFVVLVKSFTSTNCVFGFVCDDLVIDCNNRAWGGIRLVSTQHAVIGKNKMWVSRARGIHYLIDDSNGMLNAKIRAGFLQFNAGTNAATLNAVGFVINAEAAQLNGNPVANTQHFFDIIGGKTQDGDSCQIGDMDSSMFGRIQCTSNDGYYIRLRGVSGGNARPVRKCTIGMFAGGSLYAEAGVKVVCGIVNSEGTSVTCEPGASFDYGVIDRKIGARFASFRKLLDDKYPLDIDRALDATGARKALATYSNQNIPALPFLVTGDLSVWRFRMPRAWHAGRVNGFQFMGLPTVAGTGNVVLQIEVKAIPLGSGYAGAPAAETFTLTLDGTATRQKHTVLLATPVAVGSLANGEDDLVFVRITRLVAGNTYASTWAVDDVRLLYQSNAGNSDPARPYRYQPSDDLSINTST